MGARLWDQVCLPLLIGVAIAIVVAGLRFLSVRLWNYLMKLIESPTAVGESGHDQSLPDGCAAADANGVLDLERGPNGYGPARGGESVTEPELELGLLNTGEAWKEHFSDQAAAHTPAIQSPVTTSGTQQEEPLRLSKRAFRIDFPATGSKSMVLPRMIPLP